MSSGGDYNKPSSDDRNDTKPNDLPRTTQKAVDILRKVISILDTNAAENGLLDDGIRVDVKGMAIGVLLKKVNFNDMPDDCLLKIFERVPLHTLFVKLRAVCSRWRVLIDAEILARKRTLQLFSWLGNVSFHCESLVAHNLVDTEHLALEPIGRDQDLILDRFGQSSDGRARELCLFLTDLFPNVEHLVLGYDISAVDQYQLLQIMASKWAKLTSLTMYVFLSRFNLCLDEIEPLPQMHNLKSLNLFARNWNMDLSVLVEYISPLLSPLEHLSVVYNGPRVPSNSLTVEPLLARIPPNLRTFHLDTDFHETKPNKAAQLVLKAFTPEQAKHIISLALTEISKMQLISDICDRFSGLVHLDLGIDSKDMCELNSDLVSRFVSLRQLISLTFRDIFVDLRAQIETPVSLPNIKKLTIKELYIITMEHPEVLFSTKLNIFFPRLDELVLTMASADSMEYFNEEFSEHADQFPRNTKVLEKDDYYKLYGGRWAKRLIGRPNNDAISD